MGALIEARSCERFRLLAPRLPAEVGGFYAQLAHSEARHFEQYVGLAQEAAPQWRQRLRELAEHEARLATAPDRAAALPLGAAAARPAAITVLYTARAQHDYLLLPWPTVRTSSSSMTTARSARC